MVATDLETYWALYKTPTDPVRAGIRLMLWSTYVKSHIPKLTAVQEFELLEADERSMGSLDWWYK